jgi:UTP--glucose-1-phosphate uridylyltransferase
MTKNYISTVIQHIAFCQLLDEPISETAFHHDMGQNNPDFKSAAADAFLQKMQNGRLSPAAVQVFGDYYEQLVTGKHAVIAESSLAPLEPGSVKDLDGCSAYTAIGKEALGKTAVLKLNGGLGTTMGMRAPKSLIEVKNGLTFLDIAIQQIRQLNNRCASRLPLLLMNSFFTDEATKKTLANCGKERPLCFVQHRFPRIDAFSHEPVSFPKDPQLEWHPAGHGDLLLSLAESGELDRLLDAGYRCLFVSNIDNLGASIDPSILGYFYSENLDFLMEVTDRTGMDRKGGHLARLKESGRLVLRESAQCAPQDSASFSDIRRHAFFNTNNLWISLEAIRKLVNTEKKACLALIVNRKKLDPADPSSPDVLQLESALGSAISVFDKSAAVRVPRSRFAPVKNCEDLLVVWSDYFLLDQDFRVLPNPARKCGAITVSLDKSCYSLISQLRERFPHGAPSLVECESLSIAGDVRFGRGVRVSGAIKLGNRSASPAVIPDQTHITADLSW